jgi:hypothetical protein
VTHPPPRRLAVALACVVLALTAAASVLSGAVGSAGPSLHARAVTQELDSTLAAARLQQAPITYRGGPITTSSGETVDVRVSDALPVETSTPEGWAEFLTGLTHGLEISRLTTFVVTFEEVQEICGSRAAGCYGPNRMVVPGESGGFDVSPEEIVRHEYGHHIAYHRLNAPWAAVDWGPKRWASAANVCARVSRSEAFPGDQGSNYSRNPGEAWAETYRLMDERKAGITSATWPIIAPSFYPNEAALLAAEQDVLQPWSASKTTGSVRVFGKKTAKVWWIPLSTPLDGEYRINATVPSGGNHEIALVAANRRTVIRRAQWVGQRVKRMQGSVCGQRSLFVRVTQAGSLGRVRVAMTTP